MLRIRNQFPNKYELIKLAATISTQINGISSLSIFKMAHIYITIGKKLI